MLIPVSIQSWVTHTFEAFSLISETNQWKDHKKSYRASFINYFINYFSLFYLPI